MYLSASRIKTLSTCSWLYYCQYVLKIRDKGNDGANRGTVTHAVLELLQLPKHKKTFDFCFEHGCEKHSAVNKLVKKLAKPLEVNDPDNLSLIFSFIDVGLHTDFFCEGYELFDPEKKFDLVSNDPEYKALGFIDKSGKNKDEILVVDYKTSKSKFSGKDKDFNIQALMYGLALLKEFPKQEKVRVKFLFLKFKKSPVQEYVFTKKELEGFEVYLSHVYKHVKNFNIKKACSNFARNKKETFRLCGGKVGELKKDGSPRWVCPFKYPFIYFELRDESGQLITSSQDKNLIEEKMQDGYSLEEKMYLGCPAWNPY